MDRLNHISLAWIPVFILACSILGAGLFACVDALRKASDKVEDAVKPDRGEEEQR